MNPIVKYVAEPTHVREVSLFGTADLDFWKGRLEKENLVPAERDGKARLLIMAADMRFMGIRFQELSFSVLVAAQQEEMYAEGAYLAHAFNSCRLFAFCERALFWTPYYHGDVRVSASLPTSIQLIKGGQVVFRAEMQRAASAARTAPSRTGEDGWEGPVFLPESPRGKRQGYLFFARIRGHTQTFPFLPSQDALIIRPMQDSEILQALIDSHFLVKEWAVRADATHAKSKTYKRSEVFAGSAGV